MLYNNSRSTTSRHDIVVNVSECGSEGCKFESNKSHARVCWFSCCCCFVVVVVCLFCVLLPSTAESALSPTGIFDRDNTAELHQCHGCDFESVPLA